MNGRTTRSNHLLGLAAALGLVAATAATTSAQADPASGCLAYPPDDGPVIVCQAAPAGATELFEREPDGQMRQLTYLGGHITSADVSADGGMLVFEATVMPGAEPQIYRIARHGPRSRAVMVGGTVIELGRRQVMVGGALIDVPTARHVRLTDEGANTSPRFAPDGERIGFVSDRLGSLEAWSMNIDGSDQHEMLLASVR